jgi:uncharacterized protein (TIRG00374 family)
LLLVLANAFSIACLIWVLREIRLAELWADIKRMNWYWVAAASVADVAVYFWHGWRWQLVLRPLKPVGYGHSVRAIYVGLFANEILPLRAGEVLRCYLLGRWERIPFSVMLSSAAIERVFDGIWLSAGLLLILQFVSLPRGLQWLPGAAWVLVGIVLGLGVLLLSAMMKGPPEKRAAEGRLRRNLRVLIEDLNMIGHSRFLYYAAVISLPYLLIQVLPILFVMKGYRFDFGVAEALVLMVILRLGAVVPQAPGNVGLFQALATVALHELYGLPREEAARFSFVLWGVVTIPLLIAGFVAMAITGSKLGELQRQANADMESEMARRS